MPDINHRLEIEANPEEVWTALTTATGITGWWTLGDTTVSGDPGKLAGFRFQSRNVVTDIEVEALDRPTHVAWRTVASNAPGGWAGTKITFDLIGEGKTTRLDFAHRDFAEENEGYRRVVGGWAHYLQNLKQFVETGSRDPESDALVTKRCE